MTTVVVDPRLHCSRQFLFARAEARWRFRLAMTLFCLAMTVTLHSPSQQAPAHLREDPHCEALEEPDPRIAAPNQMLERPISADEDVARGARAADAERLRSEAEAGRAGADCMMFNGKDVSP